MKVDFVRVYQLLTDVNNEVNPTGDFNLFQNYPNPFNPTTTIKYCIPKENFTTLKVYNILGKEIVTLVDDFKMAGNYEVTFDATNLPSGIYFYKLLTGNNLKTRKMILMK